MESQTGFVHENRDQRHTLVVVFLRGGADGLNMIVPVEDDSYYGARPLISVSKKAALRLDGLFGLNPQLSAIHGAYQDGALAIIHGAGSEDSTRSHFEAQDFMEHGGHVGGGWLGRFLRNSPNTLGGPLSAVSFTKTQPESLKGAPAAVAMESFDAFSLGRAPSGFLEQLAALYGAQDNALGEAGRNTMQALARIDKLRNQVYRPANGATYPDTVFAQGLKQVAVLIKGRAGLEAACLELNGWDSHFATASLMDPLMRRLAGGLAAFYQDMGGAMKHATVVVMTEFGRRVYQNVSFGTDHGRGSVMFVMGGGVKGGRVINAWAGLEEDKLEGPGDLPVAYNYRNVIAPVLKRHGGLDDLDPVFPNFPLDPVSLYS